MAIEPGDQFATGVMQDCHVTPLAGAAVITSPTSMAIADGLLSGGPLADDGAAAGDWGLFQRRRLYIDANQGSDAANTIILKRRFCLTYLGKRAQLQGGVYLRAKPSVFTPGFVERMAAENAGNRYKRYPWLEKLIQLQQQLDQDQYRTLAQESTILPGARRHLHMVPTTSGQV